MVPLPSFLFFLCLPPSAFPPPSLQFHWRSALPFSCLAPSLLKKKGRPRKNKGGQGGGDKGHGQEKGKAVVVYRPFPVLPVFKAKAEKCKMGF